MIDRTEVINSLEREIKRIRKEPKRKMLGILMTVDEAEGIVTLLKEQPKKAHWVKITGMMPPEYHGHFECDNCGWHGKCFEREVDFAHCPGCGAEMSIGGLTAEDCKKTPFDQMLDDYLEATGGVVDV